MANKRFSKAVNQGFAEATARVTDGEAYLYAAFTDQTALHELRWGLEDVAFKYSHPGEYERIAHLVNTPRETRATYIKNFIQPIRRLFTESKLKCTIEGRPKHFYSIYNKMITRNKSYQEIFDLYAVRIVLQTGSPYECFRAYSILPRIYLPISDRFKDYISYPKHNGYQSIHATVVGPGGNNVEVQIRTLPMQRIAEDGIAAHRIYKGNASARTPGNKNVPPYQCNSIGTHERSIK